MSYIGPQRDCLLCAARITMGDDVTIVDALFDDGWKTTTVHTHCRAKVVAEHERTGFWPHYLGVW